MTIRPDASLVNPGALRPRFVPYTLAALVGLWIAVRLVDYAAAQAERALFSARLEPGVAGLGGLIGGAVGSAIHNRDAIVLTMGARAIEYSFVRNSIWCAHACGVGGTSGAP